MWEERERASVLCLEAFDVRNRVCSEARNKLMTYSYTLILFGVIYYVRVSVCSIVGSCVCMWLGNDLGKLFFVTLLSGLERYFRKKCGCLIYRVIPMELKILYFSRIYFIQMDRKSVTCLLSFYMNNNNSKCTEGSLPEARAQATITILVVCRLSNSAWCMPSQWWF